MLPNTKIQQSFFEALDGHVSVNGNVIEVCDVEPESSETTHFISFGQIVSTDIGPKDGLMYESFVPVLCTTTFEGASPGRLEAQEMAEGVLNRCLITLTQNHLAGVAGIKILLSQVDRIDGTDKLDTKPKKHVIMVRFMVKSEIT